MMKSIEDDHLNFQSEQKLRAALRREETTSELIDRRRTYKLQAAVMTLALFKFFVVEMLQVTNSYIFSSSLVSQQQVTA